MNYTELRKILPNKSHTWSNDDVCKWLYFINMNDHLSAFEHHKIDGLSLNLIDEQNLMCDFKICSSIKIKKLMKWIKVGLQQFDKLFDFPQTKQILPLNTMETQNKSTQNTLPVISKKIVEKPKVIKLVFEQITNIGATLFYLDTMGGKIGRLSENKIVLKDSSVSREHCEVKYINNTFFIQDIKSGSGTFIRLINPIELKNDLTFELGSSTFKVVLKAKNKFELKRFVQCQLISTIKLQLKNNQTLKIGRKGDKQFCFSEDNNMDDVHCLITNIKGKYYLMDNKSKNGLWQRLSAELQTSQLYQLSNDTVIRIAEDLVFRIHLTEKEESNKKVLSPCTICLDSPKNCVILPCRHYSSCIKCSRNLKVCPICREQINQMLKVYPK